jgi:hypothetical protein
VKHPRWIDLTLFFWRRRPFPFEGEGQQGEVTLQGRSIRVLRVPLLCGFLTAFGMTQARS